MKIDFETVWPEQFMEAIENINQDDIKTVLKDVYGGFLTAQKEAAWYRLNNTLGEEIRIKLKQENEEKDRIIENLKKQLQG